MEENQKSNFIEEETQNEMREDSFWNKGREVPNDSLDNNVIKSKTENQSPNSINIKEAECVEIINEQK